MMIYAFDKHKLPRGFNFPLNRSVLDAALTQAQIARVHCVYYWLGRSGDIVPRADYCGEANQARAAGQASITLYAVPSSERPEIESAIIRQALPQLCTWLQTAEQAGNVWRGDNHSIVFHFGSSGLAVGANQGLLHQDSTNEFSLFFGQISHKSLSVHGFVKH